MNTNKLYKDYPMNLIWDISEAEKINRFLTNKYLKEVQEGQYVIPQDIEETIKETIKDLSERDQQIVISVYKDKKTQTQCGKEFGISKARVGQILAKYLRKMARPPYSLMIKYGQEEYLRQEKLRDISSKPIEELDISARLRNVLKRGGLDTVKDILSKELNELARIRNMGKRSLGELVDYLSDLGCDGKWSKHI